MTSEYKPLTRRAVVASAAWGLAALAIGAIGLFVVAPVSDKAACVVGIVACGAGWVHMRALQ